jgi:hypothetical protein
MLLSKKGNDKCQECKSGDDSCEEYLLMSMIYYRQARDR